MSLQRWSETLMSSQVDGTTLASSAAATSILPAHAVYPLPGNFFDTAGKAVRIRLFGRISTLNPTPGNLTLSMRLGATDVASSGTMALNTTAAKTNVAFWAELIATCRTVGAAATLMYNWKVESEAFALATTGTMALMSPAAPVVGTSFSSASAFSLDVFGTWGTASASNSLTLHSYLLEALN